MSDPTLSRRAVACPGWRWLAGMRTACGLRVYSVKPPFPLGIREGDQRARPECTALPHDAVPDLGDDLTVGGLEALVRERWGDGAHASPDRGRNPNPDWWVWRKIIDGWTVVARGPTRAAALVAALDAP